MFILNQRVNSSHFCFDQLIQEMMIYQSWKNMINIYIYVQYLSYPRTLMFVSNTETTTSLSNETSWTTSLTAFSNSSTSPKTLKKREISGKTTVQKFKNKEFRKIIRLKETNNGTRNLLLTCPKCRSMSRKTLKTKQ